MQGKSEDALLAADMDSVAGRAEGDGRDSAGTLLEKVAEAFWDATDGSTDGCRCERRGSERRRLSNDCAGCCGRDVEGGSRSGAVLLVGGVGTGSSSSEMVNAGSFEDAESNAAVIGSICWLSFETAVLVSERVCLSPQFA